MPKVAPTYSILQNVYHNNSRCTERNNVERVNERPGTGGRRLCEHCAALNRAGK